MHRSQRAEFSEGSGRYWYLGLMRTLGLAGEAPKDAKEGKSGGKYSKTKASDYDWSKTNFL